MSSRLRGWLHHTLQGLREQHGFHFSQVSLELSMARNDLGDEALERLLQALQRSQVSLSVLNFQQNGTSAARFQ